MSWDLFDLAYVMLRTHIVFEQSLHYSGLGRGL